jgi:hypothetical protein
MFPVVAQKVVIRPSLFPVVIHKSSKLQQIPQASLETSKIFSVVFTFHTEK